MGLPVAGTEFGLISIGAIDGAFIPKVGSAVVSSPVGAETVLVDCESGTVHLLNPSATLVWQCFDGTSTLAEIAADVAEECGAPVEVVRDDIVDMARSAAEAGLLQGIRSSGYVAERMHGDVPIGAQVSAADGSPLHRLGRRTLLINWSPLCSYCQAALPILLGLLPALGGCGTDIVLVDGDDPVRTRETLGTPNPSLRIAPAAVVGAQRDDLFSGLGTPTAYLLDVEGRVDSKLAYGADNVVLLARLASGHSVPATGRSASEAPLFLAGGTGVCGKGGKALAGRRWEPTRVFQVGRYQIGVRAGSAFADAVVAKVFARSGADETAYAPDNFSIVLADPGERGRRDLNLLLKGSQVVARSRSPRRVVMALAAQLSALVDPEEGLIRLDALTAMVDGNALLLPKDFWRSIEWLQPRLGEMGVAVSDDPVAYLDSVTAELVVPEPAVDLDCDALADLVDTPAGRSEPGRIPFGRYPLTAWFLPSRDRTAFQLSPGGALAAALGTVVAEPAELSASTDRFVQLIGRVQTLPVPVHDPDRALRILAEWRLGARGQAGIPGNPRGLG